MPTTQQGIDTAAIRKQYEDNMYDVNWYAGRMELSGHVIPLCDAIDTLIARANAAEDDANNLRRMMSNLAGDLHDGTTPYQTFDELATVIEYLIAPEDDTTLEAGRPA